MRVFVILLFIMVFNCAKESAISNPIEYVLNSEDSKIKSITKNIEPFEIQIKYTEITRENNKPVFKDHAFNIDDNSYFYPASSVKFPVALLALEKLRHENKYTLDTPFYVEGDSSSTSFKKEIIKLFAVSDNQAYNRLFEYLGTDYINSRLEKKGLKPARISHRLSTENADDPQTKSLIFYENDSTLTHTESLYNSDIEALQLKKIRKGIGFYSKGELINEPFDFSYKNYLPISTLHDCMKRIIFPEAFPEDQQFNFTEIDRDFILKSMSRLPKEAGYTSADYYDSYVKFFMYGDSKEAIPNHIKIYNKVGYAYGYLTDCAYIKDSKNNIEFLVTATIHVNKNRVFNDDVYEYESVGIPFLAELGRQLYNYELNKN